MGARLRGMPSRSNSSRLRVRSASNSFCVTSSFGDGLVANYAPSLPEVLLGLGGVGVAFLITTIGARLFAWHGGALPANANVTAANMPVAQQPRGHEARGVAGHRKA